MVKTINSLGFENQLCNIPNIVYFCQQYPIIRGLQKIPLTLLIHFSYFLKYVHKKGFTIKKRKYKKAIETGRHELLMAQFKLRDLNVPVMVVISGHQTSGYTRVLNHLNEWMDTRYIENHVYQPDSDEEADRPFFWKYWRVMPQEGETALFVGGWYTPSYLDRLKGLTTEEEFNHRLHSINEFEKLLTDSGVLVVKIWLNLEHQQKRKNKQNGINNRPDDTWSVTMDDWTPGFSYQEKNELRERVFDKTNTSYAPWKTIPAWDANQCDVDVISELTRRFEDKIRKVENKQVNGSNGSFDSNNHLDSIDLSEKTPHKQYKKKMEYFWTSIYKKAWRAHQLKKSIVIVLEGSDAAGKGGAIRRLIRCLDARLYRVIQIAAPTREEESRHYLWRFWMDIPRAGFITVYDRSWYGRVLVERVEKFAQEHEWKRAYGEINHFEEQLTDSGTKVLKFWLQISKKEQAKRFKKREKTDYKQYKLTEEDWRNREKWDDYYSAVNDMVSNTSTPHAPWNLISAEDKKNARIKFLETIDKALDEIIGE